MHYTSMISLICMVLEAKKILIYVAIYAAVY
jgi:hypothetical protein